MSTCLLLLAFCDTEDPVAVQSVFYFDYGCVSFWNLTPKQVRLFYGLYLELITIVSPLL